MPSDVHLFGFLKKHLAGKGLAKDVDMKQDVILWLQRLDSDLLYARIHSFVPWWDEYLNVTDDYMLGDLAVPKSHMQQY
jgi:hypothetical protein